MHYRADIDGLRAIAVLFVLIYHGGLPIFPSGFVGVDIFFVISGFLITSMLQRDLEEGNFSFSKFYSRRLWRLQPVLILFILLTTILTFIFFLPQDLINNCTDIRKTLLFSSNHHFIKTLFGYFTTSLYQHPLLHTWSLSVEWQFYLLLPLVLFLLYLTLHKRYINTIIYLSTIILIVLTQYHSSEFNTKSYYQLSSRFFEFLIGGCIAVAPTFSSTMNKHLLTLLGTLALFSLFYIASLPGINIGYPNHYALVICIATAMIIALGKYAPQHTLSRLLSFKPLVFIGILSYSLYVWHWLIFALLGYQSMPHSWPILLAAYCLVAILSYLSWKFIEVPSRNFNHIKLRHTVIILCLFPLLLIYITELVVNKNQGFSQRFTPNFSSGFASQDQYPEKKLCINKPKGSNYLPCRLGSQKKSSQTAIMIGDSFSNHSWGLMNILAKDTNVSVFAQAMSACLSLPSIYTNKGCHTFTKQSFNLIKSKHYNYVILGQDWLRYLSKSRALTHLQGAQNKERIRAALDDALRLIIQSGARPIIISYPAPAEGANTYNCFYENNKRFHHYITGQCTFNLTKNKDTLWVDHLLLEMQHKYPTLSMIDPKKVQCINKRCVAEIDNVSMYLDNEGHLTDYASTQLAVRYLQKYKNPFI